MDIKSTRYIFDTDISDFTSEIVSPSSLSTEEEKSGLGTSLREDHRKFTVETTTIDHDSDTGVELEKLQGFNILDDDFDTFCLIKKGSLPVADEFRS